MSEEGKSEGVRIVQGRSPAYPYCALGVAVERAEKVRDAGATRQSMPPETFYKIWGLGALSSSARQTMAALNHFGLADYVGRGDARKVQLSDLARRIVLDKEPNSKSRAEALREAALNPPIHRDLWEKYGPILPIDAVMETYLVRDRGYNEGAAKALIDEYKGTMAFAGLDKPNDLSDSPAVRTDKEPPEVGDLVQVEIGGALQLEKAVRVRALREHEGSKWVFVEGSESGIPMEQVIVEQKAATTPAGSGARSAPPTLALEKAAAPRPGTKQDVFSLAEGDVTLQWPEILSPESYQDLEDWTKLLLRKIKRNVEIVAKFDNLDEGGSETSNG